MGLYDKLTKQGSELTEYDGNQPSQTNLKPHKSQLIPLSNPGVMKSVYSQFDIDVEPIKYVNNKPK